MLVPLAIQRSGRPRRLPTSGLVEGKAAAIASVNDAKVVRFAFHVPR